MIVILFTSQLATAETFFRCRALCEYYAPVNGLFENFYETIDIKEHEESAELVRFAKFTTKVKSAVNVKSSAFSILRNNCFDIGVLNRPMSINDQRIKTRLVHPKDPRIEVTPESVCVELEENICNMISCIF